jgi:GrpB-like predicted nucleotidyltransferase (UPF0157 family)
VAAAPIEIVPHDPAWPRRFESEKSILLDIFRPVSVQVEHVGSTAVPGLGAKPVIDILLGVDQLADVEARIPDLAAARYEYVQRYENEFPERRLFAKPHQRPRAYHLHAVERSTAFWRRQLLFRDFLRRRPDVALDYCELKRRLAAAYGNDRDGYARAKTAFIEAALERAGRELPPNQALQPTRVAQPNGQRQAMGSGTRG